MIRALSLVFCLWATAAGAMLFSSPPPITVKPAGSAIVSMGSSSNSSGATLTLLSGTVPSGAAIVVCATEGGTGSSGTLSDSVNGSYTLVTSIAHTTTHITEIFIFPGSAALSGATLTFTKASSSHEATISALYASGFLAVSPVDSSVTATVVGPTANPPTLSLTSGTPAQAGELFVGCAGNQMAGSGLAYNQDATNGWVAPPDAVISSNTNTGTQGAGGSQINFGTGTITFHPTYTSGASRNAEGIIIGLKHP